MTPADNAQPHAVTAPGLAEEVLALYERTRAQVGDADLAHIRRVAAYSQAIEARSQELIQHGGTPDALRRGAALHMLHVLLEFSELGHNIMHGSYDHLPNAGEFHSERWQWDFITDPREWKVMHHQNHHPFTNIVDKDHDLGYSILRLRPGQDWFAHHSSQPVLLATLLAAHLYYFTLYTATSAARTEGRKVLRPATVRASLKLIGRHALDSYIREPLRARRRFLHTLAGNYLGTTLGYGLTFAILALEHHAPNVELFHDPGPDETQDDYYSRQLRATTNFTSHPKIDAWFQQLLEDEVAFADRPGFEVFYGGLDTHVEHHLFPDLPPNRQRQIAPQVRQICERHGVPYNVFPFTDLVPEGLKSLAGFALPIGERELSGPLALLRQPVGLARRVISGALYRRPPEGPYLAAPRFFNAPTRVIEARAEAGGQAHTFRIERPEGWQDVTWEAGAFVSVRIPVGKEELVRQYSLVRDSAEADCLEICVKRVADGRVSNHLGDALRAGKRITLVGPPTSTGDFVMREVPDKALFIAGGVGITPIISMLRKIRREDLAADAVLLYFNRDERSIIFERELKELASGSGLRVHFVCDQVPAGRDDLESGRIGTELLQAYVPDLTEREVYVCAPPKMIDVAREYLDELGLEAQRFHTEVFTAPTLERPVEDDGRRYQIRFRRSAQEVEVDGCTTLLEAARQAGISVPTGCERGLCRACVTPKLRGATQHDADGGAFLARVTVCNSLPRSDVDLDL